MKKYESIIFLNPEIKEDLKTEKIKQYKKYIKELTDVKGHKQGYFAVFNLGCNPEQLSELENKYRADEDVIKFMDVEQDENYFEDEDSEEDEQEM